ncbi:Domain of uncharacterised function (DUF427) [Serratia marcescens]|nr:Domain of uncharacterised function (DUF427) [Serratia marcescens]CUY51504.1 Domain of uncharacterised function (DUF427) [Serratia marcescens]CVA35891.1 Domain of uncharacterised function (DUF427) [Serratia marcescens]CVA75407.1 Domain of uncharacterised function (DUF427) [Serratia marcescens]CVC28113.1 Domain of uncharacterised function (DUF427) [Serratia marcescens]
MNVFLRKKIEQVKILNFAVLKSNCSPNARPPAKPLVYTGKTPRGGAHTLEAAMSDLVSASGKPVKIPGPDHPITLTRHPTRVVVRAGGQTLADSRHALILQEATYPPVFYFPREDVNMALLQKNEHVSYCPYKGDCSYFSFALNGEQEANVAWSYEMPYNAVVAIKDHLAFYPDKVAEIRAEA